MRQVQSRRIRGELVRMKKYIVEFSVQVSANDISDAKKKFIEKLICSKNKIQVTDYKCKECGSENGLHGYIKDRLCSKAMSN